jgi:hypothetical protein
MRISEIEQRRARKEIARQLADIMACGYTLTLVEDCHVFLVVHISDDGEPATENDWARVTETDCLIDPLGFVDRARAELANGSVH